VSKSLLAFIAIMLSCLVIMMLLLFVPHVR
jgi:hypothetical protein